MKSLLVLVALMSVGCAGSPAAPAVTPAPVVSACQSNSTGTVYFQNRSASNLTYDVVWDGSKLATIAPGADSSVFTFAANVQHSLRFQITNTSLLACNVSTPVLTVCGASFYGCAG